MCEKVLAVGLRRTSGNDINWTETTPLYKLGHQVLRVDAPVVWVSPDRAEQLLRVEGVERAGDICDCRIISYFELRAEEIQKLAEPVRRRSVPDADDVRALNMADVEYRHEQSVLRVSKRLWYDLQEVPKLAEKVANTPVKEIAK